MIKACDAKVAWKPYFNVDYTAKMQIVVQSWIVQVLHVFSCGEIIVNFTILRGDP